MIPRAILQGCLAITGQTDRRYSSVFLVSLVRSNVCFTILAFPCLFHRFHYAVCSVDFIIGEKTSSQFASRLNSGSYEEM